MKKLAFVVAAASLFAFAPMANRFGPVASSIGLVWLGILVAIFASGSIQSLAIGGGALGAFGSGVLSSVSPTAAGAVLALCAFAERTTRIRSRTGRAVHVLTALVSGALAGALSNAYTTAHLSVFVVAAIVSAILVSLPLLVDADDPLAHALDEAAGLVVEPAKRALYEGAELRRQSAEVPLDRTTRERMKTTWQSLLRLAQARVRLERARPPQLVRIAEPNPEGPPDPAPPPSAADAVLAMVDQRIVEHVNVLAKAIAAVDTVSAARIGLDDAALKNVASLGDSLEDVSRALVEVRSEDCPVPSTTTT